ncbi:MAG: hypothetical protein AAF849_06485 [Bacteroidota bacterium]
MRIFILFGFCLCYQLVAWTQDPRLILPSTTDPNITTLDNPHYIYTPQGTAQNKLFVFLPGTGATPAGYQLISEEAAKSGNHVINLSYQNDISPNSFGICAFSNDITCHGRFRAEVFDGIDRSNGVNVTPANSTQNRLLKILQYLETNFPSEGWGQFLDNGDIVWQEIKLGGHSQGGGHTGYIGKIVSLDRALMFASNDWLYSLGRTAAWMSSEGETPPARYFSFVHPNDEIFPYNLIINSWTSLGIDVFGSNVETENSSPPYENSRTLNTSTTVFFSNHSAMISDGAVPLSGGQPIHDSVWLYMLNKPLVGLNLHAKVALEGAYEENMATMRDDLRQNNLIAIQEPFTTLGFSHSNGGGGEIIESGVLDITGEDAIVDWIFIRLEDEAGNFYTRSALIQKDGDVVDVNGVSPVAFPDLLEGFYQIELRSKNHLAIRTANTSLVRANGLD